MSLVKCHHHSFTVTDMDRSIAFYHDVLGLELVRVSDRSKNPSYDRLLGHENLHIKVAILRHPETDFLLELIQYLRPVTGQRPQENHLVGSSHVAFEVDDLNGLYERLTGAGHDTISPPEDVVRDGKLVARAMFALDPDGISIELFQEFEDVVKG